MFSKWVYGLLALAMIVCMFYLLVFMAIVLLPRTMIIETEESHSTYFCIGTSDDFLVETQRGKSYVKNNMKRKILIHTIAKNCNRSNDYLELNPGQMGEVNYLPSLFFESTKDIPKMPRFSSRNSVVINAVDYCSN